MALKIRLRRMGRKKAPHYRIVVAESSMPRDGRFVERLGHYNPRTDPATLVVDADKARVWISKGAKPTETVHKLFENAGVFAGVKGIISSIPETVKQAAKDSAARAGAVASGAAGKAKEAAGEALDKARDAAGDAAAKAKDVASDVAEMAKDAAGDTAKAASKSAGKAAKATAEKVADAADAVMDAAENAAEAMAEKVEEAVEKVTGK